MTSWRGMTRLLAQTIAAGFLCLWISPLQAGDRSQAFLEGLRRRAFYDVALDYLETMHTSPLADKAFLEVIDYETGLTLVAGARLLPTTDRARQEEEARTRFVAFIAQHPQHPLVTSAQSQLANLLVERGRVKMEQASQPNQTAEQKKQLLIAARTLFQSAQEMLTNVDLQLKKKSKEYRYINPNDMQRTAERDQIRTDTMQTRLAIASMAYQIAQTYEPGSKENKENLEEAAVKFGEYYQKYSRWVGGYYARIDEARCYKELGHYDSAVAILEGIVSLPEEDESFRRVRTMAAEVALQTVLLPQVKKYKEAVDIYRQWEKTAVRHNEPIAEELTIKCLAGEAALEYARGLNAADSRQAALRKENLQLAKELLTFAVQFPGENRQKAKVKLADPLLGAGEVKVEMPKTYEEARDRAKLAWDRLQERDVKPEEATQLQAEALQNFRFALVHVPPSVKIEELNTIRYCLAYLYCVTDEYYDAAVLGEFLARKYPNRAEAQRGGKIALAAYAKLFTNVIAGEDRTFENDRMTGIAQFITECWPNSLAADEAWITMIRVAATSREFGKAIEYLGHIAPDSPRRGETDLMTGQSLWAAYLDAARLPDVERPGQKEMAKLFAQTRTALEEGVARLRKPVDAGGEVSYSLAAALLSLAQICLDAGQPKEAIAWLDDPKIGPHTLVVANNPITDRGNFRVEALKATLRAYVAAQQLEKAEETISALEKASGGANLTRIYLSLGRQLEESLKRISENGSKKEAAVVARGFTAFLNRLSARPRKETNFDTLSWVAEMFMTLGGSLDPGSGKLPAEAADYYQKAAETYRAIIEACRADETYAPQPSSIFSIQIRLANCLRRLGKYGEDMDVLMEILKVQNNLINAQREAALTYQTWAEEKPAFYVMAIRGGKKVKQEDGSVGYLVWGWGGIARRVQGNEHYQSIFHEARYNLALCRFKYALSKSSQEQIDLLEQAKADIMVVYKLYPEMGGKEWRDQYDGLLKKIQKSLKLKEDGLQTFEQKSSMKIKKAGMPEVVAFAR